MYYAGGAEKKKVKEFWRCPWYDLYKWICILISAYKIHIKLYNLNMMPGQAAQLMSPKDKYNCYTFLFISVEAPQRIVSWNEGNDCNL